MERYAYSMGVRFTQSYLYIYFITSEILSENPHFALIAQRIHNRSIGVIVTIQTRYDLHALIRGDTYFNKTVLILLPIVTKTYPEDFDLQAEIL